MVNDFRAKYYRSERFWDVAKKASNSFVWKGILETIQTISKLCFEIVGDGFSIELWSRPWIPSGIPRVSFDPNHHNPIRHPLDFSLVSQLFYPGSRV